MQRIDNGAEQLAKYMEEVSEDCWYASWITGLEFALWHAVKHGPRSYGQGEITEENIRRLESLSSTCRGWIRWSDEAGEPVFVPIADWMNICAEHEM